MQPDALVFDSQVPQRDHLDGFLSRKPEAVHLGGGPVGKDGTSLDPKEGRDEILGTPRRRAPDPEDSWVQALPAPREDSTAQHPLGAPVLEGLSEMEHSELTLRDTRHCLIAIAGHGSNKLLPGTGGCGAHHTSQDCPKTDRIGSFWAKVGQEQAGESEEL
jgi:hypothetical protein